VEQREMGNMHLVDTYDTLEIIKSGILKLRVEGKEVETDISDQLSKVTSKEYRKEDIDKLDMSQFENQKHTEQCKLVTRSYGSSDAYREKIPNTTILNFASSKHPGGGFMTGAMAQEEALCHCSNLYIDLKKHNSFYEYNNKNINKGLYSDGIIYSQDVCFFKNGYFKSMTPVLMNTITCAAPNRTYTNRYVTSEGKFKEFDETLDRRIEQIIKVAIANGTDHLVLGAFGCGVFKNPPELVADIMYKYLVDKEYGNYFKQVTFAMNDSTSKNAKAFANKFGAIK
jgi:uncharacterized protein (TIGR02452 family)